MIITITSSRIDGMDDDNNIKNQLKFFEENSFSVINENILENNEINNYKGINYEDFFEEKTNEKDSEDIDTNIETWIHNIKDNSLQQSYVVGDP